MLFCIEKLLSLTHNWNLHCVILWKIEQKMSRLSDKEHECIFFIHRTNKKMQTMYFITSFSHCHFWGNCGSMKENVEIDIKQYFEKSLQFYCTSSCNKIFLLPWLSLSYFSGHQKSSIRNGLLKSCARFFIESPFRV